MKDIIDERNEKERISRSIIKYWNVNYVAGTQETEHIEEMEQTQPILEEAEADMYTEEMYNPTTGAYSGNYGHTAVKDEVTKGQIDRILKEKTEALSDLIESAEHEYTES